MPTGPDHYREAERLLSDMNGLSAPYAANRIAAAQVHAMLADTAVRALSGQHGLSNNTDRDAWLHAASERFKEEQ